MQEQMSSFDQREMHFVVGRNREIALFQSFLEGQDHWNKNLWNLYGTGGVGKSTLVHIFQLLAQRSNACFLLLDSRDFNHTETDLCISLLRQMKGTANPDEMEQHNLLENCIQAIREIARSQKVIVAFDTFEEMSGLETWLRDSFLKWLPDQVLILIAGRHSLKRGWLLSPSWRERILYIPVEHLNREETADYLERCGIAEADCQEQMWLASRGHPLTLSLAAASLTADTLPFSCHDTDWFSEVAALWLKEVPGRELRKWVEAAAVLRHFNQELLSYLLEEEIDPHHFDQLCTLSFVQRSERGWKFHDLMRGATCRLLRERTPKLYQKLVERCANYYADLIMEKSGKDNIGWLITELFHYVEDPSLRAIKHLAEPDLFYWETLNDSTVPDALAYLEERIRLKSRCDLSRIDPESGIETRISLTPEETIYMIQDVDPRSFYDMDSRSVQLLRSEEGAVLAIAIIVPLHAGTLPYLEHDPIFHPFLSHMTNSERKLLAAPPERPAGWFMRSLNYVDLTDPTLIAEGMKLIYSHMCTRGIFVTSPQPVESVKQVFLNLGFEMVPGLTHCHYDGKTPTPYFINDTRGDKLNSFLIRLLGQAGISPSDKLDPRPAEGEPDEKIISLTQMTKREQEVASLVLAGYSNAEIAKALFVSEVTVKKHLSTVFAKLGVKKRSQMIGKLLKWDAGDADVTS